jgi:hypothetical protein
MPSTQSPGLPYVSWMACDMSLSLSGQPRCPHMIWKQKFCLASFGGKNNMNLSHMWNTCDLPHRGQDAEHIAQAVGSVCW